MFTFVNVKYNDFFCQLSHMWMKKNENVMIEKKNTTEREVCGCRLKGRYVDVGRN